MRRTWEKLIPLKESTCNLASKIKWPYETRDTSSAFREFIIIYESPSRIASEIHIRRENSKVCNLSKENCPFLIYHSRLAPSVFGTELSHSFFKTQLTSVRPIVFLQFDFFSFSLLHFSLIWLGPIKYAHFCDLKDMSLSLYSLAKMARC